MATMQYDIWSVTPEADDDYYRADASIAGAGVVPLIRNVPGVNGYGYKVTITSAGDDSGITFTIVGVKVGDQTGAQTTEVVTGADTDVATSTNYYARVDSITASGASAGNVKIGHSADLALPRVRLKGFYYVGNGSAGSIVFTSPFRTIPMFKIVTPAVAATFADSLFVASEGILMGGNALTDYVYVTTSNVTSYTVLCG
jgi:hypothetical protein